MTIPKHINNKIGRNLFIQENHPICIIKNKIYNYFGDSFTTIDTFHKIIDHNAIPLLHAIELVNTYL